MKGVSALIFIGICAGYASSQFLNHRPFPTYSLDHMPDTGFSCRDKILGGYYADSETECQMFHICVKVAGVGIQDFRFLCPNGTAFDQDHQICAEWEDVDCDATTLYYSSDNFDLYRIGSGFESKAHKYGEDEETFALQRAETGDGRLSREHQTQRVNQQEETRQFKKKRPQNTNTNTYNNNNNNNNRNNRNNNNNNSQRETSNSQRENSNSQREIVNSQRENSNSQRESSNIQRENNNSQRENQNAENNNSDREIFKGSSSSNFFNNRNNGKERDEDYDDNVNYNQDQEQAVQKKKLVRKQQRRPSVDDGQNNNQNSNQNNQNNKQQNRRPVEAQTVRSNRPTGFANNFAGSSYIPTTSRPTSTTINAEQYSQAINNHRSRNGQRQRQNQQYNNAENFRPSSQNTNPPTPTYTVSTPAPFKQTQQYNSPPNRQTNYDATTQLPQKQTENYPANFPKQTYKQTENYPTSPQKQKTTGNYPTQAPFKSTNYDVPKTKQTENYQTQPPRNTQYNTQYDIPKVKQTKQTENYPTQSPITRNTQNYDIPKITKSKQTENYPSSKNFDNHSTVKKPTTPIKQNDYYPTTFTPKYHKAQGFTQQFNQKSTNNNNDNFPSTFAPRTNAAYTQISQQTTQYKPSSQTQSQNSQTTFNSQPTFKQSQQTQQNNPSTPKTSPFTQYTPTVPKISSTTPVARSNRFDETQYDDGSYNSKYDNENKYTNNNNNNNRNIDRNNNNDRREDEFLKTAHSQNIASSRNEFAKTTKNALPPSTQKPHYESPRPFSITANTPKVTDYSKSTQRPAPVEKKPAPLVSNKKVKDYDYAYYDSSVGGGEPEYEIDTEFKKSTVKN